jgi:ATP-binding cassette, subfamily C (CFTR/MRP), member 1
MPDLWPQNGKIEFKDVKLRYRKNTDLVLQGLSFSIEPGHKVGVVGRTGAGKSTICLALSRIVEIEEGSICIDGQDIKEVDI